MFKVNPEEKQVLAEVIKKLNPVTELEARFGLEIRNFGYQKNKISRSHFTEILKYFQETIPGMEVSDTLDVFFWENSKNQNSIRTSLNGMGNIQKYCRDDKINWSSSDVEMILKNNMFWTRDEMSEMIDNKIWTETIENNGKSTGRKRDQVVYDSDFQYRIGLKQEVPIVYNKVKDEFVVKRGYRKHLDYNSTKVVDRQLTSFNNMNYNKALKTFRYKRRWQFKSADGLYRFDFTVVKTGKKSGRFEKPVKSFVASGVLNQPEKFEIEIEYIGDIAEDPEVIQEGFYNAVYLMLTRLQNNKVVIGNNEKQLVLQEYSELVAQHYLNIIDKQVNGLERKIYEAEKMGKSIDKKITKALERLDKTKKIFGFYDKTTKQFRVKDRLPHKRCWVGPKPITLEKENLIKTSTSILENYSVTDKADGERALLFIQESGNCYFIFNNMEVKPVVINNEILNLQGFGQVLFDGEYIKFGKMGKLIDRFLAFDIYFKNGVSVSEYNLWSDDDKVDTRYSVMEKLFSELEFRYERNNRDTEYQDFKQAIWYKTFYFGKKEGDIYELAKTCYETTQSKENYNIDGLIFTPNNLGVGFTKEFNVEQYSDLNFKYNYLSGTWKNVFKWKPLEEQSIDFYVEIEKDKWGKDVILHKEVVIDGIRDTIRCKVLILYVGIGQIDKKIKMMGNPCSSVTPIIQTASSNFITKIPFTPSLYWYEGISRACIPVSATDDFQTSNGVRPGQVKSSSVSESQHVYIKNKSVVEFTYDKAAPKGFNWKILRIREDKTELLGEANQQRNNIFETYQRNLDLIKTVLNIDETKIGYRDKTNINNLTKWCGLLFKALNIPTRGSFEQRLNRIKKVLLNGESLSITKAENIPIQFNYGNYYITAENVWNAINEPVTRDNLFMGKPVEVDTDKYYQSVGRREDSLTFRMQEFHNKYVKTSLMWAAALEAKENGIDDIKLLDLCCGKGGDLFKWEKTNIKKILGIDVSRDNIYNRDNGACVRYMNYQKKNQYRDNLMEIDFLVGDCGNSIRMLEAFTDTKSETYYKENYLMGDGYPIKFDIVSCQFAIHYFFDSYERIQTFIDNVDDHIKKGGIFIGTCLDGNTVYNRICDEYRTTGKTKVISKDKYNNTIWSIEGLFDCEGKDFTRGDPVNFNINIQLASITGEGYEYKESLVNFGYLQMLFEKRGFKLIKNTLNNIPGESLFGRLYDKYYEKIKDDKDKHMSEAEIELSYMYRYFVFKKM